MQLHWFGVVGGRVVGHKGGFRFKALLEDEASEQQQQRPYVTTWNTDRMSCTGILALMEQLVPTLKKKNGAILRIAAFVKVCNFIVR